MQDFFLILYLALASFAANMAPVIAAKLEILQNIAIPIDGGRKFMEKELFGSHKTWRGFIVGISVAMLVVFFQFLLAKMQFINIILFQNILTALIYGFLAGLGSLTGDAISSFIKRQLKIGSGKPFVPFDQVDYIVGFLVFTSFVYQWQTSQIITLLVFALLANPLTNIIAYFLGIKKTYW